MTSVQVFKLLYEDSSISSFESNCFSELADDRNVISLWKRYVLFVLLKTMQGPHYSVLGVRSQGKNFLGGLRALTNR